MKSLMAGMVAWVAMAASAAAQDPREQAGGLQLHNATLGQLVDDCQRQTKKRFVYDDQMVNQQFMKRTVHIVSPALPRNTEEYFAIFQAVMQVNGLTLIPVGKAGEELYKIVPLPMAGRQAVPLVRDSRDANDSYITRVFKLEHAAADEVQRALSMLLQNAQAVVALPQAGIVIMTDYDYNIKRVEAIIAELDKPKPDIEFKMVPLRRALASDVEQMLKGLVETLLKRQTFRGVQPGVPGMPGAQEAVVNISADKRTNSIIILAEPERVKQIIKLVQELDSEAPFETSGIYIVHLRHTNAADVAKTLGALYKISVDTTGGSPGSGAVPGQPIAPGVQSGSSQSAGGTGGTLTGVAPTIVADINANSIIMITDRNTAKELERLVRRLDQRRPQVLIQATVVEVSANQDFDLGIELGRAVDPDNRVTSFLHTSFGQSTIVPNGNTFDIVPIDSRGITLALVHDRIGNVGAMLKALEGKAVVNILDQPEVATMDNSGASMKVTSQTPVTQTTVSGTGIQQTSFLRFETAETILSITPHISESQYLRLETNIKIEKFVGESSDPTIPPPKSSREITTNSIMVPNRRTVVIGGIVTQDETDTKTKIPLLGDIPILGALFQRTQKSDQKRTLYIFITPTILYDDAFGDLGDLTRDRVRDIEQQRGKAIHGLVLTSMGDPAPVSTFRYRSPAEPVGR